MLPFESVQGCCQPCPRWLVHTVATFDNGNLTVGAVPVLDTRRDSGDVPPLESGDPPLGLGF